MTATVRVDDRKDFAANSFLFSPALRRREAHEGFQEVGGIGRAFDEFAGSGPHGIHDDLRLIQIADRENGAVGHFLVQEFNGSQRQLRIVGGNVDQSHIRISGAHSPRHRI